MKKLKCPLCGADIDVQNDMRCSRFPICTFQETTSNVDLDKFIMYDLETSGLSVEKDHIIEIGAIYVENGCVKDSFGKLCNPGIYINQRITQITGISNQDLHNKETEEEVVKQFVEWVQEKNTKLAVGHNISRFDNRVIKTATRRYKTQYPFTHSLDTLKLAKELKLQERGITENYKQETLANQYCQFEYEAHRAVDDVNALFKIYKRLRDDAQKMNVPLPVTNINL